MTVAAQCQMCLWRWVDSTRSPVGCDCLNAEDATLHVRDIIHHLLWAEAARSACPEYRERKPPRGPSSHSP